MMTGIPTVSSVWYGAYFLSVLAIVTAFAIYDVLNKRVPNKALVCFIPFAFAAPFIEAANAGTNAANLMFFLLAVLGAIAGFLVLMAAAMASNGSNGVGGGDIKLAAVLGFIYGPYDIIAILLIASLLAMPAGLYRKKASGSHALRLAFVPFMAVGCLAVTAIKLLSV